MVAIKGIDSVIANRSRFLIRATCRDNYLNLKLAKCVIWWVIMNLKDIGLLCQKENVLKEEDLNELITLGK